MYQFELEATEALQIVVWADKRKRILEETGETNTAEYKVACRIGDKYDQAIRQRKCEGE